MVLLYYLLRKKAMFISVKSGFFVIFLSNIKVFTHNNKK